jgi:hypothetical protein
MKHNLLAASLAFAAFMAGSPALATSSCNIQTKTPLATAPGKFDHRGRSGFSLCGNASHNAWVKSGSADRVAGLPCTRPVHPNKRASAPWSG